MTGRAVAVDSPWPALTARGHEGYVGVVIEGQDVPVLAWMILNEIQLIAYTEGAPYTIDTTPSEEPEPLDGRDGAQLCLEVRLRDISFLESVPVTNTRVQQLHAFTLWTPGGLHSFKSLVTSSAAARQRWLDAIQAARDSSARPASQQPSLAGSLPWREQTPLARETIHTLLPELPKLPDLPELPAGLFLEGPATASCPPETSKQRVRSTHTQVALRSRHEAGLWMQNTLESTHQQAAQLLLANLQKEGADEHMCTLMRTLQSLLPVHDSGVEIVSDTDPPGGPLEDDCTLLIDVHASLGVPPGWSPSASHGSDEPSRSMDRATAKHHQAGVHHLEEFEHSGELRVEPSDLEGGGLVREALFHQLHGSSGGGSPARGGLVREALHAQLDAQRREPGGSTWSPPHSSRSSPRSSRELLRYGDDMGVEG